MDKHELREQCKELQETLAWGDKNEPLGSDFVCRFNKFVAEYPHFHGWVHENNSCTLLMALFHYLWHAISRRYPFTTWKPLVNQTPQVLAQTDTWGWTLLHYVCYQNPNATDVISCFVELFPDATKMKTTSSGTPLHFACWKNALPSIRSLVQANPQVLNICNNEGNAPLHSACHSGVSPNGIQYLVTKAPGICLHRNNSNKFPLDEAKNHRDSNNDVIELITTATKLASKVLMEQLCFPFPNEIFAIVATFVRSYGLVEVSMVELVLSGDEIAVLFGRGCVRQDFCSQIHSE